MKINFLSIKLLIVLATLLSSGMAFAVHTEADYNKGNPLSYTEMFAYLTTNGWNKVYYSHITSTQLSFINGKVIEQGVEKSAIYYYWKAYQGLTDAKGDLKPESLVIKGLPAHGPSRTQTVDSTYEIMKFDYTALNAPAKTLDKKLFGLRVIIYDKDSDTVGRLGQVLKDGSVRLLGSFDLGFESLLDKTSGQVSGLIVKSESGATSEHVLDQTYLIENYTDKIHGAKLTVK